MKTLLVVLALMGSMLAQTTTTYTAVRGTIHPYKYSATLNFGPEAYTNYAYAALGATTPYLAYVELPDGSTATLTPLVGGYSGIDTEHFKYEGRAYGVDSTGANVSVYITWTYYAYVRAGRGGGTQLIFEDGSMAVTK
jgi:hypothetical protein